jgi:hypothetical protein
MTKTYAISFTDRVKLEKNDYIQIYHGHGFFSYVRCNADGFKRMHEDYLNQVPSRAADYGDVIYTDFIATPDDKAKTFLDNWLKESS